MHTNYVTINATIYLHQMLKIVVVIYEFNISVVELQEIKMDDEICSSVCSKAVLSNSNLKSSSTVSNCSSSLPAQAKTCFPNCVTYRFYRVAADRSEIIYTE